MKNNQFKQIIHLTILLGIGLFLVACEKESGDSISSQLAYDPFDAIEIRTSANVEIIYGELQDIIVEGYENRIKNIKNVVVNNTLIIDEEDGSYINTFDNSINYYIYIPKIVSIDISGSANVKVGDFEQKENLKINVSGSGDIDLNSFSKTKNLTIDISGSGDVKGLANFDNINQLKIDISGSGDFSAFPIEAQNIDINISGSGNCNVTATKNLKVIIAGSGNVSYKGFAVIDSMISGTGSIFNEN